MEVKFTVNRGDRLIEVKFTVNRGTTLWEFVHLIEGDRLIEV